MSQRASLVCRGPRGPSWAALLVLALTWGGPWAPGAAWAQEAPALTVSRNEFATRAERPRLPLGPGPAQRLDDQRWIVAGVRTLRIISPEPEVNVVLRYRESREPGDVASAGGATPLRLTVIVLAEPGRRRFIYKDDTQRLDAGGLTPQRIFRVGSAGLSTALEGPPGRVVDITVQDDANAELRVRLEGETLEIQVLPPEFGGIPSGVGPPYFLGRPLRFADANVLVSGYSDYVLAEVWLGRHAALRVNTSSDKPGDASLVRGVVTAQVWRGHWWSVWLEGGAGAFQATDDSTGVTIDSLGIAAGATLHWRWTTLGAALHAGYLEDATVFAAYGHWQAWRHLGVVLSWQSLDGRSGTGLGFSIGF